MDKPIGKQILAGITFMYIGGGYAFGYMRLLGVIRGSLLRVSV